MATPTPRTPLPKCYAQFAAEALRRFEAGELPGPVDVGRSLGWPKARAKAARRAMARAGLWTWRGRLGSRTLYNRVADLGVCCDCDRPNRRYGGKPKRHRTDRGWQCAPCYQAERRCVAAAERRRKRAERIKAERFAEMTAMERNPTPRPKARPD